MDPQTGKNTIAERIHFIFCRQNLFFLPGHFDTKKKTKKTTDTTGGNKLRNSNC